MVAHFDASLGWYGALQRPLLAIDGEPVSDSQSRRRRMRLGFTKAIASRFEALRHGLRASVKADALHNAQRLVGRRLASLAADAWFVVDNVKIGTGPVGICHLAIGPAGAFAVCTREPAARVVVREHTLLFDDREVFHLSRARRFADRASDRLWAATGVHVPVRPVLALLVDSIERVAEPDGVEVMAHAEVVQWLRTRPQRLGHDMIMRLALRADDCATWQAPMAHAA